MVKKKELIMWPKNYKDKPEDTPLKSIKIETGKGIVGCEMHEFNGWGLNYHIPKERKRGFFRNLFLPQKKSSSS